MEFKKITESESLHKDIDKMSSLEIMQAINSEDKKVADAVAELCPKIAQFIDVTYPKMLDGGRLFYMGAGTSGRLGIVDASECPPTFGVPHGMVVGLIAGGDSAIRKAVEFAEDSSNEGWKDLESYKIDKLDTVVGIAASGTTPYVLGALAKCKENGITTGGITCNPGSPLDAAADYSFACGVGPEFITGSTRMKSGTAQKLILNMISTGIMVKLGRVKGNRMVDMQLSNNKLVDRGTRMVMESLSIDYDDAKEALLKHGSVRMAVEKFGK